MGTVPIRRAPISGPSLARFRELKKQVLANWQYGYLIFPLSLVGMNFGSRSPIAWFLFILLIFLSIFWLAFTHLEGRFFILAVPICALLISHIPWGQAVAGGSFPRDPGQRIWLAEAGITECSPTCMAAQMPRCRSA